MSQVSATRSTHHSQMSGISFENVDDHVLLKWTVNVKNLISKVAGQESEHYQAFTAAENGKYGWSGTYSKFKALEAVFSAAKDDFEGGYLASFKSIIQAEVFENELEQASELLGHGYYVAAAVICRVVLETALIELCDRENLEHGKLNKMNADLAKAGTYNKLVLKQITAWADIGNSAAHGKNSEFTETDVKQLIPALEQFLANHVGS